MSTAPIAARHVLLTGPPGSGKSTLGPMLAAHLGAKHIDLDASLEAAFGVSLEAFWRANGEAAFRARERATLCEVLARAEPHVVALGGGALLAHDIRRRALAHHTVLSLTASTQTLLARLGAPGAPVRPLLVPGGEREARALLDMLLDERADAYAEAHAIVSTDGSESEAVAALAHAAGAADMVVPLGARGYPVHVVDGGLERALSEWSKRASSRIALWVVDDGAYAHHGPRFDALAEASGAALMQIRGGELAKHLGSVQALWDAFARFGVSRSGVVAIAGGGAVLDQAAFAASCWHRGTAHVLIPTTLMGMADAAVGGKTAVNLGLNKNLVGSTWQPRAVFADCTFLASNPTAKWRADQAEVLKVAALGDAALAGELLDSQPPTAAQLRRALAVKIALVAADEQDRGVRALLNFGHTVGHALETLSEFALPHGAAVAAGMRAETAAMVRLGHCAPTVFAELAQHLDRLGFPKSPPGRGPLPSDLRRVISGDKKAEGGVLRLCALRALGEPAVVELALDDFCAAL